MRMAGIQDTNSQGSLETRTDAEFIKIKNAIAANLLGMIDTDRLVGIAKEMALLSLKCDQQRQDLEMLEEKLKEKTTEAATASSNFTQLNASFQEITTQNNKLCSERDQKKKFDVGFDYFLRYLENQVAQEITNLKSKLKTKEDELTLQSRRHKQEVAELKTQLSQEFQKVDKLVEQRNGLLTYIKVLESKSDLGYQNFQDMKEVVENIKQLCEERKVRSSKRTLAMEDTLGGSQDTSVETAKKLKAMEGSSLAMSRAGDEIALIGIKEENQDEEDKENCTESLINTGYEEDTGSEDSPLAKTEKHLTEIPESPNNSSGKSIRLTPDVMKDTETELSSNQDKGTEFESSAIAETGGKTHKYEKGDWVFAKLGGYPRWPAQIQERVADREEKYLLIFYGTHNEATIKLQHLVPYTLEYINKYGKPRKPSSGFMEAMKEIESGLELYRRGSQDELEYIKIEKEPSGKLIRLHNISDKEVSISRTLQIIHQSGGIRTHYKFNQVKVGARAFTILSISSATAIVHECSQINVMEGQQY